MSRWGLIWRLLSASKPVTPHTEAPEPESRPVLASVYWERGPVRIEISGMDSPEAALAVAEQLIAGMGAVLQRYPAARPLGCETVPGGVPVYVPDEEWEDDGDGELRRRIGFRTANRTR